MSRKYKNPPIVEAVCEFQFDPESEWDIAIPGLLYEKLRTQFPHRQQVTQGIDVALATTPEGGVTPQVQATSGRIRFYRDDRQALVQVGPHLLTINHLQPYPTWEGYLPLILQAYSYYLEVAQPNSIKQIELRYINRVELPVGEVAVPLMEYFDFYPYLGPKFPVVFSPFIVGIQIPYPQENSALRLQLASAASARPDVTGIIIDLDYFILEPEGVNVDRVSAQLQLGHDRVEEIFEACLTDRVRTLFEEENK